MAECVEPLTVLASIGAGVLMLIAGARDLPAPLRVTMPGVFVAIGLACLGLQQLGIDAADAVLLGALFPCCLLIAEIDRRSFLIPDLLTAAILILSAAGPLNVPLEERLAGAIVLGALFLAVRVWFARAGRADALGLGDVKLAVAMGAFLGPQMALVAVAASGLATLCVMMAGQVRGAPAVASAYAPMAPFGVGMSGGLMTVAVFQAWIAS